jgi:hypothetical protein
MRLARAVFAVLVVLVLVAAAGAGSGACAACRGSTELGLDAGIRATFSDDFETALGSVEVEDVVTVAVPVQSVRVGFFVSDRVQVEPSLGFVLLSVGGETLSQLSLGVDLLAAFASEPGAPAPYVTIGALVTSFDDGDDTATQFGVAGGLGVKFPQGDRWAVRLEGGAARLFENEGEALAAWNLFGTIGFSFFAGG